MRRASMQPMGRRFGKEFVQGNALSAYQQLTLGLEYPGKSLHARKRFVSATAFHFNRNRRFAFLQDEIHFMVSFEPIGDADVGAETGIDKMSADAGLNQPSPTVAVLSGLGQRAAILCAH